MSSRLHQLDFPQVLKAVYDESAKALKCVTYGIAVTSENNSTMRINESVSTIKINESVSSITVNDTLSSIRIGDGTHKASLTKNNGGYALDVSLKSGLALDAFERLRVATATSLFDSKSIGKENLEFDTVLANGGTSTYRPNESCVDLEVTTTNGSRVLKRTHQYFSYAPGRAQEVIMTACFATGKEGLEQLMYYGDDRNAIGFKIKNQIAYVFKRSYVTGTVVETEIPQSEWNVDIMDGNGTSGRVYNYNKSNIYVISGQWLGVGQVQLGLDIDGHYFAVHNFQHAGNISTTYMTSFSLPVSYEIKNTSTTASNSIMKQICSNVFSSGLTTETALSFSVGNDITLKTIDATGSYLIAIRSKLEYPTGYINRRTLEVKEVNLISANQIIYYEIRLFLFPSAFGGSWTSVNDESATEYSVNPTFTGSYIVLDCGYVSGGGVGVNARPGTSSAEPGALDKVQIYLNQAGTISGYIAVFAKATTSTSLVGSTIKWLEFT